MSCKSTQFLRKKRVKPTASCRRHDILITPYKRNEVERSVGWQVQCADMRARGTLLHSDSCVSPTRSLPHAHVHPTRHSLRSFRVGLLGLRASCTLNDERVTALFIQMPLSSLLLTPTPPRTGNPHHPRCIPPHIRRGAFCCCFPEWSNTSSIPGAYCRLRDIQARNR